MGGRCLFILLLVDNTHVNIIYFIDLDEYLNRIPEFLFENLIQTWFV